MAEHAGKPKVRFAGFTEAWEQRKLEELTNISSASRVHKGEWTESGVPFFRSSDVVSAFKGEENEKAFISYSLYEGLAKKSGKVQEGDVLITGGGSIGIPYLVKNNEPLYFKDADLLWLKQSRNLVGNFLYTFFTAPVFSAYVQSISHIGTIAHYTIEQLKDTPILFPKVDEQQKIGTFFRHLDRLITLHQRKRGRLENIKKAMLEKMFPKNGADVPEIRFAGFTEAWEQRKLGEIADKVTEKNTTLRYTEALTNSAEFGIIGQRDFFDHDVAKLSSLHGYYIVKEDDFVYNPRISVTAPVGPVNRNKLGKIGVVSPLYTVLRTAQIDNEFLEWFFKSACWHSFMIFNGDSGARSDRFSIKNSTFFEMPIPCPCRMEQVRIGTFFRHLDRLITLHQRKVTLLQNIKKACLEKMFV